MWWNKLLIGVLVVSVILFGFLYWRGGLACYLKSIRYINTLDGAEREKAKLSFYGNDKQDTYGGIVAGVWTGKYAGVWLWTRGGLRFFPSSKESVFSYFNGCIDGVPIKPVVGEKYRLNREIYLNIAEYKKQVNNCDFGEIRLFPDGLDSGNIWEIWTNDWWPFMQTNMKEECKK